MSPGSVNHVPQCETLPSILLYIYPGVATCIDYQSILSLLCFSLWDMIFPLPLLYTYTRITAYTCIYLLSPSLSLPLSLSPSLSLFLNFCSFSSCFLWALPACPPQIMISALGEWSITALAEEESASCH